MVCPSPTDDPSGDSFNPSPDTLAANLKNGIGSQVLLRRMTSINNPEVPDVVPYGSAPKIKIVGHVCKQQAPSRPGVHGSSDEGFASPNNGCSSPPRLLNSVFSVVKDYGKFIGPGFMISVAYIDPGNYSTDVAAGAASRFHLLFVVLISNIFAIFLQSLCIRLGTVSGLNLAEACRAFLPRWMNYVLYFMAEIAIVATDIAEVIGTAIAINLLIPKIPLVAGCAMSIMDVMLILLFYNPNGSMKGLRVFEYFVMAVVLGVVVCFCIQLSLIQNTSVGEVFRGYIPSKVIIQSQGLYQACGILGATVMPHSLYLGSAMVQPRLQEYDQKHGLIPAPLPNTDEKEPYYPSLSAIRACLNFSIIELTISLFTFALFINSAILVTAGASLSSSSAADPDLFGIYNLLASSLAPTAGTIFALALLLSGISAGIVCTIAGQIISEGALNWKVRPWLRRLLTRSISITPSIIIAGAVGRTGLNSALNGTQVVLSVVLPFVTAPLIWFTAKDKYMTVLTAVEGEAGEYLSGNSRCRELRVPGPIGGDAAVRMEERAVLEKMMRNHWFTTAVAVLIWLVITCMNFANLVLLGKRA